MKAFLKAFFFTLSLLFCVTPKTLSANNQLITELKVLDNDSSFRYLYLYDNNNHKVLETKYIQRLSVWQRYSQTEWLYNGENCTDQVERIWLNNKWKVDKTIRFEIVNNELVGEVYTTYPNGIALSEKKINYEYQGGNLKTKSEFSWTNDAWELVQKMTFTYTADYKTDSVSIIVYENAKPTQFYLTINDYSTAGLLTAQVLKTRTDTTNWTNHQLTTWYYKPKTTDIEAQIIKCWDSDINSWKNSQRVDYQYGSSGELLSEMYQNWQLVFWADDIKYDYQYEIPTKLIKKTISFPLYHQWRSMISIQYSDFSNDNFNTMESRFEFWGGTTGELTTSYIPFQFNNEMTIEKARRIEVNHLPVNDLESDLKSTTINSELIHVYPNPSQGMFYIDTQKYAIRAWQITDVNGKLLKIQEQTTQSGVIDISDLSKGIYLLKVMTSDGQYNQKLIKN